MVQVIFYEKPGCLNNSKQKKRLREAGLTVVAKNLLTENWQEKPEELRTFFADKPVADWFNLSAPLIKQGIIDPATINAEQAIGLMLSNPLLIRRPLMQAGDRRMAGFNEREVERWLGLDHRETGDLESCSQPDHSRRCHA